MRRAGGPGPGPGGAGPGEVAPPRDRAGRLPLIPCVGGVVLDDRRRLLVVRRAQDPGAGLWSIPGGRVEPGESDEQAVVREVWEETAVTTRVVRFLGAVERAAPGGGTYVIRDFLLAPQGATRAVAGDDAADVRWATGAGLADLPVVEGLLEALASWDALPQ